MPGDGPSTFHASGTSQLVTWTCFDGGDRCPWGDTLRNQAAVWPIETFPTAARLGYVADQAVYLDASKASGLTLTISTGSAVVYSGDPAQHERFPALAALDSGQSFRIGTLPAGTVMSVESSGDAFVWEVSR